MSSLLSLRQRQAGYTHPLTLAPNVIKTLRGKKIKKIIRVFHHTSSGLPAFLQRGKDLAGKEYEKDPQILQNISKNIFSYASLSNLSKADQLSSPFCTPHFLTGISQDSSHCPSIPRQNLTVPPTQPRGAAAVPPSPGTCNGHLCADLSQFLPKMRRSI